MGFFLGLSIFILLSYFLLAAGILTGIILVIVLAVKGIRKWMRKVRDEEDGLWL